jgi:hypothetical protein
LLDPKKKRMYRLVADSLDELKKALKEKNMYVSSGELCFVDEEGDEIYLDTTRDFEDMMEISKRSGVNVVRLKITKKDNGLITKRLLPSVIVLGLFGLWASEMSVERLKNSVYAIGASLISMSWYNNKKT